jgi:arylsulfatase A
VPPPAGIDGISMVPSLLGQGVQPRHEFLYWEFHEQGGKQAVRQGPWKGIRLEVRKNPAGPLELYHLEHDPGETVNLASFHPEKVEELAALMDQAHQPSPDFPFLTNRTADRAGTAAPLPAGDVR